MLLKDSSSLKYESFNLGNHSLKQVRKQKKNKVKNINKIQNILNIGSIDGNGFSIMEGFKEGLTPRYNNISLESVTTIDDIKARKTDIDGVDVKTGRPEKERNNYQITMNEIKEKLNSNKPQADNTFRERNDEEDNLFNKLHDKNNEYNQLKDTVVLNGQLNNSQLTNKSSYLKYILWLIASITMGGLVIRKVLRS